MSDLEFLISVEEVDPSVASVRIDLLENMMRWLGKF